MIVNNFWFNVFFLRFLIRIFWYVCEFVMMIGVIVVNFFCLMNVLLNLVSILFFLIVLFFFIFKVKGVLFNVIVFSLMCISNLMLDVEWRLIVCFVGVIMMMVLLNGVNSLLLDGLIVKFCFIVFELNILLGILESGMILLLNGVYIVFLFVCFVWRLFFFVCVVVFLL